MSRLGRGLNSLIHDIEKPVQGTSTTIKISDIIPNRYQPRRQFDKEKLLELSQSIQENGLIQPIIVCQTEETGYELIAGERRLEACKLAGLSEIPVVVKNVTDKERLVLAIIENVQREDLSPLEEAKAYQQLIDEFELNHSEVSKIMGKDRTTISNTLRLLKLSENIQHFIENKEITPGHARAILSVDEVEQENFAKEIIKKQYSVRQAEENAKLYNIDKKDTKRISNKYYDKEFLITTESKISDLLKSNVKIREKKDSAGEILIKFSNEEELCHILESIGITKN
ncbi:MAG: ParB/RepB/Spo0J family partition protein [Candidatus Cloacimonetes bacterium]|jgi:ParB family chromosome partitioning protein|nr:ParB/RepB/Spo0J family partition protein [Candidatus Cloacimonadota bacterium]MDD4155137.1 ParB/RepB/Spo0J family partition protein [Candidatus Cloacimonadota bacterium]